MQFKEVEQIRSSASDHVVASCSNFVFYSAFYRQPVQIHKNGGDMFPLWSLADKTSSTVYELCLRGFEEYQSTGNYSNLNGTGQDM